MTGARKAILSRLSAIQGYRYYSGMTSRDKSVIPPEIMAKLADIGASLRNGSSALSPKGVLDGLSTLPAHTAAHVSRSIQIAASLHVRSPSTRFLLVSPFRSRLSEADLIRFDPAYAWLFLFHSNGHVRQVALETIQEPPDSPFFLATLALRLNDWVQPVRRAAMNCAERVLTRIAPSVVVQAAPYLLNLRFLWGRWSDEYNILEKLFDCPATMIELADFLRKGSTGPLGTSLRYALRFPGMDHHLPRLAAEAIQPAVRAVAHEALITGQATWCVGFQWMWVDKVYGIRKRIPKLGSRRIFANELLEELICEGIHDPYAVVRRIAADGLVASYDQLPNANALLALIAEDKSASVRLRGEYLKKKLSKI
jgi:hypothetical protein